MEYPKVNENKTPDSKVDDSKKKKETPNKRTKYLVICGCTLSGIGKGTTMSSIGITLKSCGYNVTCIKIDPYLNTDAGLISPIEHGEVFVLEDGGEVDLDLGNYERALNIRLTKHHNITSGKIFSSVLTKERNGDYLGKTVQMVPHVTDHIIESIIDISQRPVSRDPEKKDDIPDICLIEIGGTVGDLESAIYFEAIRHFMLRLPREDFCLILLTYIPEIGEDKEQKTKPSQHGYKELKSLGLTPDFIICRSDLPLSQENKRKIAMFSNLREENVISAYNCGSLHEVPLILGAQELHSKILNIFGFNKINLKFSKFIQLHDRFIYIKKNGPKVNIAVCGKYTKLRDSYLSVIKALNDAATFIRHNLNIVWIETTDLEITENSSEEDKRKHDEAWKNLKSCDGILIPGGFGKRGVEGKIKICQFARENKIPFFGICLGLQVSVIEVCRNVVGFEDSNSTEFDEKTIHDVVIMMLEFSNQCLGGTARLGSRETIIEDETSLAYKIYKNKMIHERHRHRFEVNPKFINYLEKKGGVEFSGKDKDGNRMEIIEIPDHPFFLAVQFHPEFQTNYFNPSPPFLHFVAASAHVEIEIEKQAYKDLDDDDNPYINFTEYYEKLKEKMSKFKEEEQNITQKNKTNSVSNNHVSQGKFEEQKK